MSLGVANSLNLPWMVPIALGVLVVLAIIIPHVSFPALGVALPLLGMSKLVP